MKGWNIDKENWACFIRFRFGEVAKRKGVSKNIKSKLIKSKLIEEKLKVNNEKYLIKAEAKE